MVADVACVTDLVASVAEEVVVDLSGDSCDCNVDD